MTTKKRLVNIILGTTLLIGSINIVSYCSDKERNRRNYSNSSSQSIDIIVNEDIVGLHKRYNYNNLDRNEFQTWIKETLDKSREEKIYAIIIDKAAYELNLCKDGEIIQSFPIELGRNPFDDKISEGDCCTPEGKYIVSTKKDIGQTVFYRAFLINYPNTDDWLKFKNLKYDKYIPSSATIGGAIEIHGCGSGMAGNNGGFNWTLGCIALSNDYIDILFEYVNKGTSVTIVKYGLKTEY